jgi:serine/threonine protein kinase
VALEKTLRLPSRAVGSSAETFPRPFGKYELLEKLGAGGTAEVFRARHPGPAGFEKIVVIKRLLPQHASDPTVVKMLIQEASIAAKLVHRNVVQVFELGQTSSGEFFIAMEYVAGIDLRGLLRAAARRVLRIPIWFSVHVVSEVLAGLAHAHDLTDEAGQPQAFLHRDVTPANILLSKGGDVKLADFGFARVAGRSLTTDHGEIRGTVSYMSPEQIRGEKLDSRADVFSASVVLWECLTQRRLFGGGNVQPGEVARRICSLERPLPSKLNPEAPAELDDCVLRGLEIDRSKRTGSAIELQEELVSVISTMGVQSTSRDVAQVVMMLLGKSFAPTPPQRAPSSDFLDRRNFAGDSGAPSAIRARPAIERPMIARTDAVEWSAPRLLDATGLHFSEVPQDTLRDGTAVSRDDADWEGDQTTPDFEFDQAAKGALFFRRGVQESILGPVRFEALLEQAPKATSLMHVSGDQHAWIPLLRFLELCDPALLPRTPVDFERVQVQGTLDQRSITALFGILVRDRASGRLIAEAPAGGTLSTIEVSIASGRLKSVASSDPRLALPSRLVTSGVLGRDEVRRLLHQVAMTEESLESLAAPWVLDLDAREAGLSPALVELFRWRIGRYCFEQEDPETTALVPREAPLVLSLVPQLIARSFSEEELLAELDDVLDAVLEPSSRLTEMIEALPIDARRREVMLVLAGGRPLATLLAAPGADRATLLGVAYLMIELDLLIRPV